MMNWDKVYTLWMSDVSIVDIASTFDVHPEKIRKYALKMEWPSKHRTGRHGVHHAYKQERWRCAYAMWMDGVPQNTINAATGVSGPGLIDHARRNGWPSRMRWYKIVPALLDTGPTISELDLKYGYYKEKAVRALAGLQAEACNDTSKEVNRGDVGVVPERAT